MFAKLIKSNSLKVVNYSSFHKAINEHCAKKIRQKGGVTYIYDKRNRILAKLKMASIDAFGRVEPAQYFVRAA